MKQKKKFLETQKRVLNYCVISMTVNAGHSSHRSRKKLEAIEMWVFKRTIILRIRTRDMMRKEGLVDLAHRKQMEVKKRIRKAAGCGAWKIDKC